MKSSTTFKRSLLIRLGVYGGLLVVAVGIGLAIFPGRRLPMALVIATGIGKSTLQEPIDALEAKAINKQPLTAEDKAWLLDFYHTLATGAKLSIRVAQTGRLMERYLDKSGQDYRLDPEIFTTNAKVRRRMKSMLARSGACRESEIRSPVFYMPDQSNVDSIYGLYYGRLILKSIPQADGTCFRRWRAEVPWEWPSYESIKKKYGIYDAESFPMPNGTSLLLGKQYSLFIDNGLGEYLTRLDLARTFLAYAEWTE